jgi:hypothetical protein
MAPRAGWNLSTPLILWLLAALAPRPAPARDPAVEGALRVVGGDLYASASVPGGALIPDIRLRMDAGLPVVFTYRFQFYRVRRFWFDRTVAERLVTRRASYDPLSALYKLESEISGEAAKVDYVRDRQDAEFFLEHFDAVNLGPAGLDRPTPAGLRARLRVHFLAGTVLFIPWDKETGWQDVALAQDDAGG